MVATREGDPQMGDHLNLFVLSIPAWIIGNITVRPVGCLQDRLAPHWLNNLPFDDMLKGRPSSSEASSCLLCNCMAPSLR